MSTSDTYVLGRSDAETRRLTIQHQLFGPLTRRFFQAAGIGAGMKVLDVGSGAGDVALLVADLVGPRGRVVGVDMNAAILETARARTASAGWTNVEFLGGDVTQLALDTDFDAIVGRWVLMHMPDPTAALRYLVTRLKVGGIAAFHENDFTVPPTTLPPGELTAKITRWFVPPPDSPGPETRMGTKLLKCYLDAGLPTPEFMVEAVVGGGADWPGYAYAVETFRSLMPAVQRLTGLDPAEVQIDTLADRMREDGVKRHAIMMLPIMFGAWTRKGA